MGTDPQGAAAHGRLVAIARHAPPLLGLILLAAAVLVVERVFRTLRLEDVLTALDQFPRRALLSAFGFTLLAYGVLTFYDWLGARYAGARISYARTAFASFCAYALSHNLGFAAVSGAAVRFRLYAHWGLSPVQIGKIIAFCSLTFGLGAMVLGGAVLVFEPGAVPLIGPDLPPALAPIAGFILWGVVVIYVIIADRLGHLRLGHQVIDLPGARLATLQVAVAAADVAATSTILWALLPAAAGLSYFHVLAVYVVATSAGLAASLPAGIGVFDSIVLLGLSPYLDAPVIVSAILVFRLYYSVIPLFVAGALFALNEILIRGRELVPAERLLPRRFAEFTPRFLPWSERDFAVALATGAVTLCGTLLLLLGVVRTGPELSWLDTEIAPYPGATGQFLLSLLGAGMLAFAYGLSRRVTLAWGAELLLLLTGAFVTLLSGVRWWVPALLLLAAFLIAPFRRAFYRHTRLLSEPVDLATTWPLLALVFCVLALSAFERHVRGLAQKSWWTVIASPEMPLAIRLNLALAVLLGILAIWQLVRPGRVRLSPWDAETEARYLALAGTPPPPSLGLLWGEEGEAAIPVCRIGHLLVGLGDPIGARSDRVSVIWRLRDLAEQEGLVPAVIGAGTKWLAVYNDIGLSPIPLDAEGRRFILCRTERDLNLLLASMKDQTGQPQCEDGHVGDQPEHREEEHEEGKDPADHLADGRVGDRR